MVQDQYQYQHQPEPDEGEVSLLDPTLTLQEDPALSLEYEDFDIMSLFNPESSPPPPSPNFSVFQTVAQFEDVIEDILKDVGVPLFDTPFPSGVPPDEPALNLKRSLSEAQDQPPAKRPRPSSSGSPDRLQADDCLRALASASASLDPSFPPSRLLQIIIGLCSKKLLGEHFDRSASTGSRCGADTKHRQAMTGLSYLVTCIALATPSEESGPALQVLYNLHVLFDSGIDCELYQNVAKLYNLSQAPRATITGGVDVLVKCCELFAMLSNVIRTLPFYDNFWNLLSLLEKGNEANLEVYLEGIKPATANRRKKIKRRSNPRPRPASRRSRR